jgi:hypothetical protein
MRTILCEQEYMNMHMLLHTIDKFRDRSWGVVSTMNKLGNVKNLEISKETKVYRHSWKQGAKVSITAKL